MGMRQNDRVMLFGSTGSGKTTLAAVVTLPINHLAVYDVKRELSWLPNSVVVTDIGKMTYRGREVFQPAPGKESDKALFERFCRGAYDKGNVLIWIDEAAFVTSPHYLPQPLENILVAGRSRGIGCMALSQSGAGLSHPMLVKSAQHVYVGYGNDFMLRSLEEYLGSDVMACNAIAQFSGGFLLWENNAKHPVRVKPVNIAQLGDSYARTG